MTIEEMKAQLSQHLSKKRFIHTLGVVDAAVELAEQYGADIEKAKLAALLHDSAKEYKLKDMQAVVESKGLAVDSMMRNSGALLHGLAGMIVAEQDYGVIDPEVLEAIRVHTTGKPHMFKLDKIVFLADYIEVNRDFPGVEALRDLAKENLNQAVLLGYDNTIQFLLDSKATIYTLTIEGRNALIEEIQANSREK